MADIRIKDLPTTATQTASDDFIALDGTVNGTRKIDASAPSFKTSVTSPSIVAPAATALTLTGGSTGASLVLGQASTDSTALTANVNLYLQKAGASSVVFRNNAAGSYTEAMRIAGTTGNLLIGTTTDINRLTIAQDAGGSDVAAGNGQVMIAGSTNTNKRLAIGYNTTSDYGWMQAALLGTAYKPIAINPNGGNLLIGTTSDSGARQVNAIADSSTTFAANFTQVGLSLVNTNTTANNWLNIQYSDDGATPSGIIGHQITDHTNNYGLFRFAVRGTGGFVSPVIISPETTASSIVTGALQVAGGVGATGGAYFGGSINQPSLAADAGIFLTASGGNSVVELFRNGGNNYGRIVVKNAGASVIDLNGATGTGNFASTTPASSSTVGALTIGNGTAAFNVAIGAGRVDAGDSITAGNGTAVLCRVNPAFPGTLNITAAANVTTDLFGYGDGTRHGLIRGNQNGANISDFRFGYWASPTFTESFRVTTSGNGVGNASTAVNIYGTSASTGSTSGALQVAGGIYAGAASVLAGPLTVGGTGSWINLLNSASGGGQILSDAVQGVTHLTSNAQYTGSQWNRVQIGHAAWRTALDSAGDQFLIYRSASGANPISWGSPLLTIASTGAATFAGAVTAAYLNSTGGNAFNQFGSGTRTKTALSGASGEVAFDNGTVDSPGVHFYTGNNANYGIDATSSSGLRLIKNLDETSGTVVASFTDIAATFTSSVIAQGTGAHTFGTTNTVSLNAGAITATNSTAGGTNNFLIRNLDNTNAASAAVIQATVGGANAGDPRVLLTVDAVVDWSLGVDNSDSDKFKIGPSGTVGTSTALTLTSAGAVSFAGTVSPQQATTAGAPAYVKGAIYFDTTLNKLRVGGATAWETITSV